MAATRRITRRRFPESAPAHVLTCLDCGSTFSIAPRPGRGSLPRCDACSSANIQATRAAEGVLGEVSITCRTCRHTWPIMSPSSVAVCPSCDGNPLVEGVLVERDGIMGWIRANPLAIKRRSPPVSNVVPAGRPTLEFPTERKIVLP